MTEKPKVGDKVFVIRRYRESITKEEHIVAKVGRKYFITSLEYAGEPMRFALDTRRAKSRSWVRDLFAFSSLDDWDDLLRAESDAHEHHLLSNDVRKAFPPYGRLPYSLDQLRRIKAITEEPL